MHVLQIRDWKKIGHAHNQCLHIMIKVLLVNCFFKLHVCNGLKHARGIWHNMIGQKYYKLGK